MSCDVGGHYVDLTSRLAATPGTTERLGLDEARLLGRYPGLSGWPADAQLGLLLLSWLLGPGFNLPDFRPVGLRPDFWSCSAVTIAPKGRHGVVALNSWLRRLFRNAALVQDLGMEFQRVYFPADLSEMLGFSPQGGFR